MRLLQNWLMMHQEEADDLLEEIKNLGEVSKKVLILFKKLPLEKIKIDNTRK